MAKLSAHGSEIGRIELPSTVVAYMSDGKVLRNQGSGWKLYKKIKPGINPIDAFNRQLQQRQGKCDEQDELTRLLKELVGSLENRRSVMATLSYMPDDIDGVWSELDERGFGLSLDDVKKICFQHKLCLDKIKRHNQPKQEQEPAAA